MPVVAQLDRPACQSIRRCRWDLIVSLIKRAVSLFTGNGFSQSLLEFNIKFTHYLMGVGAGTQVHTSGEISLVRHLQSYPAAQGPLTVLDVGANVGKFSGLIREHCEMHRINIHAFEPSTSAFEKLTQAHSDCPAIRLNNAALGAQPGTATLYFDQPASGLGSLTKRDLDHVGKQMDLTQSVQVTTLDHYCEQQGIQHIHLLKIDVEGHELDVLQGAAKMFADQRIDAVTFEFGGCNIDTRTYFRDFYQFFDHQAMSIYRITPRGYLRLIKRYRETNEQFITTNYFATRRKAA